MPPKGSRPAGDAQLPHRILTSNKLTVIDSIEAGFNLSKLLVIDPTTMNLDGLVVDQGRLVIRSY
jgi:hypothetical protein